MYPRRVSFYLQICVCAAGIAGAQAEAPSAPPVEGEVTLAQAAALTLLHNPDLAAFQWEVRAAEARVLQAGLRPNPELSVEAEEVRIGEGAEGRTESFTAGTDGTLEYAREKATGTRSGLQQAEFTITVTQLIELGRKRMRRVELAEREKAVVEWDYAVARQAVLTDTARNYAAVLSAQERVGLADRALELAKEVERVSAERVNAGDLSPIELTNAEAQTIRASVERDHAQRDLDTARAALAALWGETEPHFTRAADRFGDPLAPPDLEGLRVKLAQNPELARWATEMEQRRAALRLARAEAVPDMSAGAGVRLRGLGDASSESWAADSSGVLSFNRSRTTNEDDTDITFVLGVTVPLPVFNRNQGNILEAQHRASQASDQRRAAEAKAGAALYSGHRILSQAYAEALALQNEVIPRAEDAYRRTEEGYRAGKFSRTEVIATERALLDARSEYVEALAAYHEAAAEVSGLINEPLFPAEDETPGEGKQ